MKLFHLPKLATKISYLLLHINVKVFKKKKSDFFLVALLHSVALFASLSFTIISALHMV